jgi:hypothetical protein
MPVIGVRINLSRCKDVLSLEGIYISYRATFLNLAYFACVENGKLGRTARDFRFVFQIVSSVFRSLFACHMMVHWFAR